MDNQANRDKFSQRVYISKFPIMLAAAAGQNLDSSSQAVV